MRYQQPIYIQNEHNGVRNKDILNVNMSSDLCVFQAPVFTLSGASKIDCNCGCTGGYTLLETGICQFVDTVSATSYGTIYTAHTGNTSVTYGNLGTNFYSSSLTGAIPYMLTGTTPGYIIDASGVTITSDYTVNTGDLWFSNSSALKGRLNKCGVWALSTGNTENQWIGFSKCVNIDTTGLYSVGIAGDNRVKFSVNSDLFYYDNLSAFTGAFTYWRVFELNLSAGTNVIELQGYNDGSLASFGAEIYNVGISGLTGLTTTSQLDAVTVFTTKDYRYEETGIPLTFDLGESSGYSCPAGYFLNTCDTGYTCGILVESGCTVPTGQYYIVDTATTIPLTFDFTSNLDTFTANSATFKYEVYKYNLNSGIFTQPPVYKSDNIGFSAISGTSSVSQSVPISGLSLDGQYLVKGYYNFDVCTEYLNKLGKKIDTSSFIYGSDYGIYDNNLDFYFTAINIAEKPQILASISNTPPAKQLFQQVILPQGGQTNLIITNEFSGFFILTLNGLVLAPNYDYTFTGNVITLSSPTVLGDIVTVSYTTDGGNTFVGDNININTPVVSGTTNNEGNNTSYFNTTTGKYEIYTTITPADGGSILVMINGITLANNIDYYQSTSNKKRIILEGDLLIGDIITIVYFPVSNVVNGIFINNPTISWLVNNAPQLVNGYFSLEVSTGSTFNTMYYSGSTDYIVDENIYSDSFIASGSVGTTLYYRVKNTKDYETVCGVKINTTAYSETIPITIQSNSINSY